MAIRTAKKKRTVARRRKPVSRSGSARGRKAISRKPRRRARVEEPAVVWRPTSYYGERLVPLLIRWPKALIEKIDAEVARRQKPKTTWGYQEKVSRAEVIRELVEKQLGQVGSGQRAKK